MPNLKIIYPSGAASQVTYTCVKNPDYGHEIGYLDTDDKARGVDGSLNCYPGPRKRTFNLTFSHVLKAQLDAWQLAWVVGAPIDLYLDGTLLEATVLIMESPVGASQEAFVGGAYTYSFDVTMEEV